MYYERVFKALEKRNVRYAVAGGVALVLHGKGTKAKHERQGAQKLRFSP